MFMCLYCNCDFLLNSNAPWDALADEGGLAPVPIITFVPLDGMPSPKMYLRQTVSAMVRAPLAGDFTNNQAGPGG